MITARLSKNRHEVEVDIDGKNLSVDDCTIGFDGKRRYLLLKIFDFKLKPDSQCPERRRIEAIFKAAGDPEAMAKLEPSCSIVLLNSNGCNGCPDRPV
jgi:hypothetical protein